MAKRPLIAVSVTTEEAFVLCLKEEILLITAEAPLYPEIKNRWMHYEGISMYTITDYPNRNFAILKKTQGARFFDDNKYEIFYFPLRTL